jgi:uncharacterized lipoprotein YehR (DUF1307 family)
MKTKLSVLIVTVITIILLSSCTQNARTRNFGGSEELQLKPNEVLINITWKENNMWVLTEDTLTNIKYFRENSNWGVWEGEVIVK